MILFFHTLISCTSSQEDTSLSPLKEISTPQRYVLSSMLFLNRSGRLFLYDQEEQEQIWELNNPEDPVWLDAHISDDGSLIHHNVVDVKGHDPTLSEIRTIRANGEVVNSVSTPGAHHSFVLFGDGFATITTEFRTHPEYGTVAGDRISYHHVGPSSTILSTFYVLNPAPMTTMWDFGHFEDAKDWTHANALRWYPEKDSFVLTIPGINAIWVFDGEVTMKSVYLGKDMIAQPYTEGLAYQDNPYAIYEGGSFDMPHGASMDEEGTIWVLSNGLGGQTISYAQGYAIENDTMVMVAEFPARNPTAHSAGLGSVVRDREDTLIINWGIYGQIESRSLEGEEGWLLESNLQEVYGFSNLFDTWNP